MLESSSEEEDDSFIFGSAFFDPKNAESDKIYLDILERHGITRLDTARVYGDSEKAIGLLGASKKFSIDTKARGFSPGSLSRESVLDAMKTSLAELQSDKVRPSCPLGRLSRADLYAAFAGGHDLQ